LLLLFFLIWEVGSLAVFQGVEVSLAKGGSEIQLEEKANERLVVQLLRH